MHKRDIENDSRTQSQLNHISPETDASTITSDTELGSASRLHSRKMSRNQGKRNNSEDRNQETEKSEVFKSPVFSSLEKSLMDGSVVKYNAPGVCLSGDRSEAEKQCAKHDLCESIKRCQDLEAICSSPCLDAANICSATESDGNPVSDVNNPDISLVETHDDHVVVANPMESEMLSTYESRKTIRTLSYSRRRKIDSDPLAVDSKSISHTRSLLLLPEGMEKRSLVQSVETLPSVCSKHLNENKSDEADVGNPTLLELCACRDVSSMETHDDRAVVANPVEAEMLSTYERRKPTIPTSYSRRRKFDSDPTAVDSKSIRDTRFLPLVPELMENPSLVQSVEALPSVCSEDVNEKKCDEADVRNPSLLNLCASRDEVAQDHVVDLLSQQGSLTGSSRKKLLVLDINGLLADIVYQPLEGYTPDTIISGKSVFKRPFCDDFLEFCFAQFNVGIWSSRARRNVESILDFLLGNTKHRLLFCWDQSHCTNSNRTTVENRRKPLLVKKLKKLWQKSEPNLPWELGEYNESNTLLLDDSPYKAVCNPPYTAVFPPSYRYSDKEDNSLGPGGELRVYLEGLALAENVQKYVEENPIGERPITEKNPSWRFYLDVIRACSSPENSPEGHSTFHWQVNR